jgi:hypothetical protein
VKDGIVLPLYIPKRMRNGKWLITTVCDYYLNACPSH